jgi:hypothetical protein
MISTGRGLRAGPAPLTLDPSGRWTSIAAAAGDPSRGCRVLDRWLGSGGEAPYHLSRALPVGVRHNRSWSIARVTGRTYTRITKGTPVADALVCRVGVRYIFPAGVSDVLVR